MNIPAAKAIVPAGHLMYIVTACIFPVLLFGIIITYVI